MQSGKWLSSAIILAGIVFFFKGVVFLDPDFGWHLKAGEFILKQGIPKTDPFSYTMSSYPFIDHEWLTDVFFALSYPFLGQAGLAAALALIGLLALVVSLPKDKSFSLWLFILSSLVILGFIGVRPQVLSWLFLAVLQKILLDKTIWARWKIFLPLLFFAWANLHGGFMAGLILLFLKGNFLILMLSSLATLINPYGLGLWIEVLKSITDTNLRWTIQEWSPALFHFNPAFLLMAVLSATLLVKYYKKLSFFKIAVFLFFLVSALSSIRNVSLWVVVALPLSITLLQVFYKDIAGIEFAQERFKKAYSVLIALSLFIALFEGFWYKDQGWALSKNSFYPVKAVEFVKNQNIGGELFSSYGWGGYLIWQLPQKKVFIDGRMPSWKQSPKTGESGYAMGDYLKVDLGDAGWEQILQKYQISTVLWPITVDRKPRLEDNLGQLLEDLFPVLKNTKKGEDLGTRLKKAGWKEAYRDHVAVVYTRD